MYEGDSNFSHAVVMRLLLSAPELPLAFVLFFPLPSRLSAPELLLAFVFFAFPTSSAFSAFASSSAAFLPSFSLCSASSSSMSNCA